MIYIALASFTALSPFFLWVYYLAVMSLKKNKENLKGASFIGGSLALVIGYLLDAYVNFFVLTVVLLELPRELTVTARFRRHYHNDTPSWRSQIVQWFLPLLEPYDPGHITNA